MFMLGFFSLWPIEHYRSAAQVLAATKEQLCCSAATGCSSNLAVFIIHRVGKADTIAVIFYLMLPQKLRKKPAQKKVMFLLAFTKSADVIIQNS